jgi:hypothetical protein
MTTNQVRCLPRPIPARPAARRGFVVALLVVALAFVGLDAYGQVSGSSFTITRFFDGTNIINAGDNANNAIRVNVVAGSAAGVSHVDDAAFAVTTDDIVPAGFMFDDVTPDSVNEGDAGVGRMSANRNQYIQIRDNAGNERGLEITAAGEAEVSLTTALPAGTNNIGDVDVLTLPALAAGTNNIGDVDVLTLPNASTANNDGAQVSMTTTSAAVLASFSTRKAASVCASPSNTDVVHIKLGATATTSDGKLWPGQCWNTGPVPYTGQIDGRSATGTQELTVWEW